MGGHGGKCCHKAGDEGRCLAALKKWASCSYISMVDAKKPVLDIIYLNRAH